MIKYFMKQFLICIVNLEGEREEENSKVEEHRPWTLSFRRSRIVIFIPKKNHSRMVKMIKKIGTI